MGAGTQYFFSFHCVLFFFVAVSGLCWPVHSSARSLLSAFVSGRSRDVNGICFLAVGSGPGQLIASPIIYPSPATSQDAPASNYGNALIVALSESAGLQSTRRRYCIGYWKQKKLGNEPSSSVTRAYTYSLSQGIYLDQT